MKKSNQDILTQIKQIVTEKDALAKILLYGSRSRDTARNDSDWDIVILLNKDVITLDMERDITYPLYDLEFDSGEVISPLIYSEKEWNGKYKFTPFYKNVMKDGILL